MDLRDQFAVHIAAALVGALTDPAHIATRAYDLAEAMLAERERRLSLIDLEERRAIEAASIEAGAMPFEHHAALLDVPAPMDEEDEEIEPPYDPTWDLEPADKIASAAGPELDAPRAGPGLARTLPESAEPALERSA